MNNFSQDILKRLQIIEEKFEYQDQTLETLNDVIIGQQVQIKSMEETLAHLNTLLSANLTRIDQEDPLPPHY